MPTQPHNKAAAAPKKKAPANQPTPVFVPGADPLAVAPSRATGIVGELTGFTPQPTAYDPKLAEDLLATYRLRLSAIAPGRLDVPRIDVEAVCRVLLAVCALTEFPPLRAVYEGAAAQGEFHIESLAHLKAVTLVLLHAYRQADAAGAFASGAKIPAALDKESLECEARMQKVCEHFFGADPTIGPLLRRLSPGTGYLDRAYDLFGYADIYEQQLAVVSTDPVHYRATDGADARRTAGEIIGALGAAMTPKAREAYDTVQRAWTLLKPLYFETQEIGLRSLRYDPRRQERFPSLYVVGRTGQGRKKTTKDEGTGASDGKPPTA